jgi:nucleotide-binding universal stress UspA family protein
MPDNIVVGVDGSDNSFVALSVAADLAEETGSPLSIAFVHDLTVGALAAAYEPSAEQFLEQATTELEALSRERAVAVLAGRPVKWTFDVAAGEVVHELIDLAHTRSAALIVVGGRSHSLLGGLILGSVAQKLVRSSPISVLVVRHPNVDERTLAAQQRSAR